MNKSLRIGAFYVPDGYNNSMPDNRFVERCQAVGVEETVNGPLAICLNHVNGEYLALWPVWLRPVEGERDALDIQKRAEIYATSYYPGQAKEMGASG